MEHTTHFTQIEKGEDSVDLGSLSDKEIELYVTNFFAEKINHLSQKEMDIQIASIVSEIAKRDINGRLFFFLIPLSSVTSDEKVLEDSSWVKVYRSLFNIARTEAYKNNEYFQEIIGGLESVIEQNPQMVGTVALWDIAKDMMWRKDIPSDLKEHAMIGMTGALAFSDIEEHEKELLKQLDFIDNNDYTRVSRMLEALKQLWYFGHDSYAKNHVPDFYTHVLKHVEQTPDMNYLLSVRAQELVHLFEQGENFVPEKRDKIPFELSKGTYAYAQEEKGLFLVPDEQTDEVMRRNEVFVTHEKALMPSEDTLREARTNHQSEIIQHVSRRSLLGKKQLLEDTRKLATIPIDEALGSLGGIEKEKREELVFDYEYLVSRPIREMIQREFH